MLTLLSLCRYSSCLACHLAVRLLSPAGSPGSFLTHMVTIITIMLIITMTLTHEWGIRDFDFEAAVDDGRVGSEVQPGLVGRGVESDWLRQPLSAVALDDVVRTVSGGGGTGPGAHGVVLSLRGELLEDYGESALGVARELPQAVDVDAVAEVGEERRSYNDWSTAGDLDITAAV